MALEPNEIEIPLNLGMATKPSEELAAPDAQRLVENLHWRGAGEMEKRPVHSVDEAITAPAFGYYDETDSCGLIVRDQSVAVVTGRYGVATWTGTDLQYNRVRTNVGSTPDDQLNYCPVSYEVSRRGVERSQGNLRDAGIFQVASSQHSQIHVIAWISQGQAAYLRAKAIDVRTGAVVATTEIASLSSSAGLMVQACEYTEPGKAGVLIAYINDSTSPFTISTIRYDFALNEFVQDADLVTNAMSQTFLVQKRGTGIYLAYHDSASGFLTVQDRTITSVSSTHTATHGAVGVDIVQGPTRTLIVSCTTSQVYAEVYGTPANVINPMSASSETFYKITAALEQLSGGTHDAVAFVTSQTSVSPSSTRVRGMEFRFTTTTPVAGLETVQPHCMTVANAFTLRGHVHVVFVVYPRVNGVDAIFRTKAQPSPTSCIVARYRAGGVTHSRYDAVAKILHDRFFITNHLTFDPGNPGLGKQGASVYVDNQSTAWLALTGDPAPAPTFLQYYYPQTIYLSRISAPRPLPQPYVSPEPGIVFVADGMPWEFDGDMATEAAAVVRPVLQYTTPGTPGFTGTFSVIAVYRWVDALGREHRMPSAALTFTIANSTIDLYVSRCPMRAYGDATAGIDMEPELYATGDVSASAPSSTYWLVLDAVTNGNRRKYDSVTADGLWYKFTNVLIAGTGSNVPYFGNANELTPEPTCAFLHVAKVADRLWAVDAEDRTRVWFSKPLVPGYGVEWTVNNTLTIGDECVAVADMGGGAMVLARGGIYLVTGAGPDANGDGIFSPAVKLNHTVDCVDPVSVCRTPLGVIFRGRRGWYSVNGGDAVPFAVPIDPEFLTDPANDPSAHVSIRMRAVYQEQTNEIHISGAPGSVGGTEGHRLVFNLLEQKWSRYAVPYYTALSNLEDQRDLAIARGRVWRLTRVSGETGNRLRDDRLFSEDNTDYNTDSATVWTIDTPWYRLADVSGQFRLWRGWVALGLPPDVQDIGTVTLRYYVNNGDQAMVVTWTGAEIAAAAASNPSLEEGVCRLPFMPNVQVVHSFRLSLTCSFSGNTTGPKPLSLRLRFGVRPSMAKQNPVPLKG